MKQCGKSPSDVSATNPPLSFSSPCQTPSEVGTLSVPNTVWDEDHRNKEDTFSQQVNPIFSLNCSMIASLLQGGNTNRGKRRHNWKGKLWARGCLCGLGGVSIGRVLAVQA